MRGVPGDEPKAAWNCAGVTVHVTHQAHVTEHTGIAHAPDIEAVFRIEDESDRPAVHMG
ncbi:MAG: hypothetical protein Q8L91_00385 [Polaromonas sp.]|nr:hypothetical protein [Polaromonas sp.]